MVERTNSRRCTLKKKAIQGVQASGKKLGIVVGCNHVNYKTIQFKIKVMKQSPSVPNEIDLSRTFRSIDVVPFKVLNYGCFNRILQIGYLNNLAS